MNANEPPVRGFKPEVVDAIAKAWAEKPEEMAAFHAEVSEAIEAARPKIEPWTAPESQSLGVNTVPPAATPVLRPAEGGIRLAVSKNGLVGILLHEPQDTISLTPEQAHDLGRGLIKHAAKARKVKA